MRSTLVTLALIGSAAAAGRSAAQPAARPSPAESDRDVEVDALVAEGTRRADARDYRGALDLFERAYALAPTAQLMLKRGVILARLGRRVAAAAAFQAYLDADATDPALGPMVRAQLDKLDGTLGRLRVAASGAAEIKIDDGPWQAAPRDVVRVAPGGFRVAVRAAGGVGPVVVATGTIGPGETRLVPVSLPAGRGVPGADDGPVGHARGPALGYGAIGLGAAAIVGGAVLLLVVDEAPVTTPTTDPTYTEATVPGLITLGAGVALAGVGAYLVLHRAGPAARVTPMVGAQRGAPIVGATLRF